MPTLSRWGSFGGVTAPPFINTISASLVKSLSVMKRIANAEETVNLTSRDKRSKVASSQDKCDVCLEPMEMSGKSSHPGCIKKSGFLALPKENKAFKLARDSVDNKVPCPKCMFRDFNLDVVKKLPL
ncbi:hypothetical protein AGABI1DRAFT_95913 [Agaricus bisporus var. burnettii JB137-S8]|uniref:Uncharacterized protein n=1 Tax=Agaricus bisporus var. burnettii (strain JB137-S8 / ATCC MYA-4627 / FGSC 10392) TaxID=597362 RepID=K5WTG8_AGABU|nr:uncharacterized protein AGABI1DRAFT_95913 [Agaricus bisporus var. burnettii JB137-S8]EKM74038.1 hypothetical protein AGABI1DRAFT_95913 [Agaricus bisporus var. burnettii JB137-S8]